MKLAWRGMVLLVSMAPCLTGCSGGKEAAEPSYAQREKLRQQYIEQAKAFNAEPKPGQQ